MLVCVLVICVAAWLVILQQLSEFQVLASFGVYMGAKLAIFAIASIAVGTAGTVTWILAGAGTEAI